MCEDLCPRAALPCSLCLASHWSESHLSQSCSRCFPQGKLPPSFVSISRHSLADPLWAAGGCAFGWVTLNMEDMEQVIWNKQLSVCWCVGEQ